MKNKLLKQGLGWRLGLALRIRKPNARRGAEVPAPLALFIVTSYDKSVKKARSAKPKRGRPPTGEALTAAERMRRMRERRKAAGLKPVLSWQPARNPPFSTYSQHRLLDIRSLAMHAMIAQKIDRDPSLLSIPRANLERWRKRRAGSAPGWLAEWEKILDHSWADIAAIITAPDENATRLRQSSPFAGVLTSIERKKIHDAFRA